MYPIEITNLTKDYGHGRGVFDVSFAIERGQVFGFLGPNGAGKSTTIRHLMGFSAPDSGQALINGANAFAQHDILKCVGYLPAEIVLPNGLNSIEFIEMMKGLYGAKSDRVDELLQYFEYTPNTIPLNKLSLGDKRKLSIITAFLHDPDILVLDEPTSGLDIRTQRLFIDFVKSEKQKGKTVLLSSHIFSEVEATCDKIAIIKQGRIVTIFDAKSLDYSKKKIYEATFTKKADATDFASKYADAFALTQDGRVVTATIRDSKINEFLSALSRYNLSDFSHKKETLMKYFMKYYQSKN